MSDKAAGFGSAAYGGPNWSPRSKSLADEIGSVWADCGVAGEWQPLRAVLLHRPGAELGQSSDPDAVQMLAPLDLGQAQAEHDAMAQAYKAAGVAVHYLEPPEPVHPNQMFLADLMFMTPEGAVLARPASTVRAGEERHVARRLATLGIPILRSLRSTAVFEGADAAWVDRKTVLIGRGLRTNDVGIAQVGSQLQEMGVTVIPVDLPHGTMHLMGMLRFADRNLALAWPRCTPHGAVMALRERGYEVAFLPEETEASRNRAFNFVTLGPRRILMVAGNPVTQAFYEDQGITCLTTPAGELAKAAGAIGCLTGVLWRDSG